MFGGHDVAGFMYKKIFSVVAFHNSNFQFAIRSTDNVVIPDNIIQYSTPSYIFRSLGWMASFITKNWGRSPAYFEILDPWPHPGAETPESGRATGGGPEFYVEF